MTQPLSDEQLAEIEAFLNGPHGRTALVEAKTARRLAAEIRRLRELLALAAVLEIPRPGTALPLQLRRSYGHTDRWAICDGTDGRRWHREHGWVYETAGIRDEALRDGTRYTLAEAVPLARQLTEGACPGFEKKYQGVSDAKRRLASCKHCGQPRTAHTAAVSAARP